MCMVLGTAGASVPAVAFGATGTVYVNNAATANCSDSAADAGTPAQPYCSVQAAADAAQPGETVQVAYGFYGAVDLKTSGTSSAPITITGAATQNNSMPRLSVATGTSGPSLTFDHVHNVTVSGFDIGSGSAPTAVAVVGSSNASLDTSYVDGSPHGTVAPPLVTVDGQSSGFELVRSWLRADGSQSAVSLASGATGTVLTTNIIDYFGQTGVSALTAVDAPGTVVASNSFISPLSCNTAISLTGNSSGSTLVNNAVQLGTAEHLRLCYYGTGTPVIVSQGSATGTKDDYNSVETASTGPLYSWAGQPYTSLSALQAADSQSAHDTSLLLVPGVTTKDQAAAPFIDSADQNAPYELSTDVFGHPRVDDPLVANTGTGVGYYDRGAYEYQDPYHIGLTMSVPNGLAPLAETLTATESNPWGTKIVSYTFDFGDGQQKVSTSPTISHVYTSGGPYNATVTATSADGATFTGRAWLQVTTPVTPKSSFFAVTPTRVLDTRDGTGGHSGAIGANSSVSLKVAGLTTGSTTIPSSGVTAVVLNVTAVSPTANSYVSVYGDQDGPGSVTLMTAPHQIVSNLVTVPVKNGVVDFYNHAGSVNLAAVITGYYSSTQSGGGTFTGIAPTHLLDTRNGTGLAAAAPLGPEGVDTVQVTGPNTGVPNDGTVTAVALNVTAISGTSNSYLALYPGNSALSSSTSMSFAPGQIMANTMIVPVDSSGTVKFFNHTGYLNATADITGYYRTGAAGSSYVAIPTQHLVDTRSGLGAPKAPLGAGSTLSVNVTGIGPVPYGTTGVVLNVTALSPTANSYLSIYPDTAKTGASTGLDFAADQSISNMVVVPVINGSVDLYNHTGNVNVVADILGYYAP